MEERYIGRNKLLDELSAYKNPDTWNPEMCNIDTVKRVLLVVENIVKHQPQIGKAELRTRQTDAMRAELAFHRDHLLRQRQHDDEKYLCENSLRHDMTAGFYRGRVSAEEEVLDWLERMVRDA
jgi:hypothetical protein|nr:MAG TPA_asm: hypothetical protein [Caudoviricetes sp.]